jgi:hypothetical protein
LLLLLDRQAISRSGYLFGLARLQANHTVGVESRGMGSAEQVQPGRSDGLSLRILHAGANSEVKPVGTGWPTYRNREAGLADPVQAKEWGQPVPRWAHPAGSAAKEPVP